MWRQIQSQLNQEWSHSKPSEDNLRNVKWSISKPNPKCFEQKSRVLLNRQAKHFEASNEAMASARGFSSYLWNHWPEEELLVDTDDDDKQSLWWNQIFLDTKGMVLGRRRRKKKNFWYINRYRSQHFEKKKVKFLTWQWLTWSPDVNQP